MLQEGHEKSRVSLGLLAIRLKLLARVVDFLLPLPGELIERGHDRVVIQLHLALLDLRQARVELFGQFQRIFVQPAAGGGALLAFEHRHIVLHSLHLGIGIPQGGLDRRALGESSKAPPAAGLSWR